MTKRDIFFGIFVGVWFIVQLVVIKLPFYWDTANFLISSATKMAQTGDIWGYLSSGETDYPHTPGFIWLSAIVIHLFPYDFGWILRIMSILVGIGIVIMVDRYEMEISQSRKLTHYAAYLLLITPLFFNQTHMAYFELPALFLRLMAIWFLYKNQWRRFLCLSLLAGFFRFENWVGLAVVAMFVGWQFRFEKKRLKQMIISTIVLMATFCCWIGWHWWKTKWWFIGPTFGFIPNYIDSLNILIVFPLLGQGRWLLWLSISLLHLFKTKKIALPRHNLLIYWFGSLIVPTLGFLVVGAALPRYSLPLLLGMYFVLAYYFVCNGKNRLMIILTAILTIWLLKWGWRGKAGNFEDGWTLLPYLWQREHFVQETRASLNFLDNNCYILVGPTDWEKSYLLKDQDSIIYSRKKSIGGELYMIQRKICPPR